MSHTFLVPLASPPDLRAVLATLPVDDVEADEGLPAPGSWPEGAYVHLFRRGVSCRTVELGFDGEGLHVRIFTSSSADDVLLALALVQELALRHGVPVQDEHGDLVPADAMDAHYDGFAEQYARWGAEIVPRMLAQGDVEGPLTLPGPGRDFVVGRRLVAAMKPREPGYVARFYERMRMVRWYDPEGWWHHAQVLLLDREDGFEVKLAALGPGVRYLMPDVHGFALHTGDAAPPLFLPADQLPQLVDVEWLDERQFLLDAIPAEDWSDFLAVARQRCQPIELLGG